MVQLYSEATEQAMKYFSDNSPKKTADCMLR